MFLLIDTNSMNQAMQCKTETDLRRALTVFPMWREELRDGTLQVFTSLFLDSEKVMEIVDG